MRNSRKWVFKGLLIGFIPGLFISWTGAVLLHNSFLCGGCLELLFSIFFVFLFISILAFGVLGLLIGRIIEKRNNPE